MRRTAKARGEFGCARAVIGVVVVGFSFCIVQDGEQADDIDLCGCALASRSPISSTRAQWATAVVRPTAGARNRPSTAFRTDRSSTAIFDPSFHCSELGVTKLNWLVKCGFVGPSGSFGLSIREFARRSRRVDYGNHFDWKVIKLHARERVWWATSDENDNRRANRQVGRLIGMGRFHEWKRAVRDGTRSSFF